MSENDKTPADKLRELLATRPQQPNLEELVRWWRSSTELVPAVLTELAGLQIEVDAHNTASTPAFDEIAKLCGCPQWDYPGQLIRDVQNVVQERDALRADLERVTACLKKANENHEDFERRWYLAKDDLERERAAVDVLKQEVRELEEQRDAARSQRMEVCTSMCGSNECRIRKQCTKVDCTSLYGQIDYEAWETAMHNIGALTAERDQLRTEIERLKRDELMEAGHA